MIDTDLPDGVYPNLSDEVYFAQNRYGSTDMTVLSGPNPEDWWWGSRHNPHRKPRKRTPEMDFGSGLHAMVLESDAVFRSKFVRSPYDNYTAAGARLWLSEQKKQGLTPLKGEAWDNVYAMDKIIKSHPQMKAAMAEGLPEVAVLFTYEGIKFRAKFDKLWLNYIGDLKTFGSHKVSVTTEDTVCDIIVQMKYDAQRFLYDEARRLMIDMIGRNKVYGATEEQKAYLNEVAEIEQWEWLWIFYKGISTSETKPSAPIVTPVVRPPCDATWVKGQERVKMGISNLKHMISKFGLETPWVKVNHMITPDDSAFEYRYDYHRNKIISEVRDDD